MVHPADLGGPRAQVHPCPVYFSCVYSWLAHAKQLNVYGHQTHLFFAARPNSSTLARLLLGPGVSSVLGSHGIDVSKDTVSSAKFASQKESLL